MNWHKICLLFMIQLCVAFKVRNTTKYSPRDLFFTKPKYFTAAFTNSVKQDYVRLKLHAFIFDVPSHVKQEKVDPSDHLRRLAKPYPQILLDPGYTFTVMVDYFPLKILEQICEPFQAASRTSNEHVPTSIFVVNDVGTMVNRPGHDRLLQLFFQITASLGLPTLTWMPNRVGTFELEDNQLVVRLEPLTWHLARALVDFAQTFNWNFIIVLYNEHAPGSKPLLSEIKRLQVERGRRFHPNFYEFEIEAFLGFDGFTNSKLSECTRTKRKLNTECFGSLIASMQEIWEAQSRFVIFNGNQADLNALTYLADVLEGTEYAYLTNVFGKEFVWIFTPSTMAPLQTVSHTARDSIVMPEFTMFKRIPGLFGLMCLNDADNRRRYAKLAREVWHKSVMELLRQTTTLFPPEKLLDLNSTSPETVEYYRSLLERLRPGNLCENSEKSESAVWQWGRRLSNIMKSIELNFDGEGVSFLPNGGLNVSKLIIFNSRTTSGRMKWHRVGTWSMSSNWGRKRSQLLIDGVTWPGGANSPPKGRASRIKAVMLQEQPMLIYGNLQEDGTCDANSIPCWIRGDNERPKKKTDMVILTKQPPMMLQNYSGPDHPETRRGRKLACCTGLSMDLLTELMKDLNFEVELYEVYDRLWGGWTKDGWNGLVRELMDQKADMAITSLKITPNRSEQIDFSVPFLETGIAITVALREGAISPTAFLEPYDYQCWCIILLFSVHASGAAIYLYEWLSPVGQDRGRLVTPEHRFTLCRSLWLIWSMLFGAAVNVDNPRGMASRFMANIWALFALVFLASYTANLAAFMISKDDFYDIKGIHDWRLQQPWNHKPPFRFATIPSGATEENIKMNFPEMAAYMRAFNRTTVVEGLKSLKSEEIDAFIYDATISEYWASRDDGCKLKTVGNLYAMTGYGIGFPKGSQWLPKVNSRILNYQKNGKFHRWKQFWLSGVCKKVTTLGNTNKTLGVKNFISAFILLLCGMFLCGIIFLLEHAFYRYIWRRIRNSDQFGCCALAVVKPTENNLDDNVETNERSKFEVRSCRKECKNTACQNEKFRNQQEIARLSRRLRFLLNEANSLKGGQDNRHLRNEATLPSTVISAQQLLPNFKETCTVIKIPRTSWSNENDFNGDGHHPIIYYKDEPAQIIQRPNPILRRSQKYRPKVIVKSDKTSKKAATLIKSETIKRNEVLKELPNSIQRLTPKFASLSTRLPRVKSAKECVEKESVI